MRYAFSALLLVCSVAQADTVWLKNGGQVVGRLLYLDFGSLAFKGDHIGRINIPIDSIRTLDTSGTIQVKHAGSSKVIRSRLYAGEPGTLILEGEQVIALKDIDVLVRLRDRIDLWHWEGNLDLAITLDQEEGKDEFEVRTKLDTRVFNHRWRHSLNGEVKRKSENDERKDNNFQFTYDLDRFYTENWFARGHGRVRRDYMGDDSTEREMGIGVGYQFWDNVRGRFSLTVQISRLDYRYHDTEGSLKIRSDIAIDTLGLAWDFKQQMGAHGLELFTTGYANDPYGSPDMDIKLESYNGEVFYLNNAPLEDIGIVASVQSGIRYHVTDWIHLSIRHDYDYITVDSNSVIDRHYFIGLGVSW